MSVDIISENCYTCRNCLITKQFCRLKNKLIQNIYRDKCDKYVQREIEMRVMWSLCSRASTACFKFS